MKLTDKITNPQALNKIINLLSQFKLEQAELEIGKLESLQRVAGHTILGEIYSQLFKTKKVLNLVEPHLKEVIDQNDQFLEGTVRFLILWCLVWQFQTDRFFLELQEYENTFSRLDRKNQELWKMWESNLTFVKGFFSLNNGNFDQAINLLTTSAMQAKELGGKSHQAVRLVWLSHAYASKGDLDSAQEVGFEALEIAESKLMKYGPLQNLAIIDMRKGNFTEALDKFQQSYDIMRPLPLSPHFKSIPLDWMGKIYHKKGDWNQANKMFLECLKLREDITDGGIEFLSRTLFGLIHLSIDMNSQEQAKKYIKQLEQLQTTTDNAPTILRCKLAKAFITKQEPRLHQRMKAYEQFQQIVNENIEDYELRIFAILNFCELLLLEYTSTGETDPLKELKVQLQSLIELGYNYQIYELIIEVIILQSKISMSENKNDTANDLLLQALTMCRDKNIPYLIPKITHLQEKIFEEINQKLDSLEIQKIISNALQIFTAQSPMNQLYEEYRTSSSRKYKLVFKDLISEDPKFQENFCRVGIAQIGISRSSDILSEFYEETHTGLFGLKKEKVHVIELTMKKMIDQAYAEKINILLFPELSIDLNYKQLMDEILLLAKKYNMYIIPGSFHNKENKKNVCVAIGPEGVLWKQEKHIPAKIMYKGERFLEGIDIGNRKTTICNTKYGRIVIIICRDFLDMDLRVELKNFEPPVDLVFNIAFTPVTADFKAAHFDARRSIYAYCFFANIAEFGDSFIYTPEKERTELNILPKQEGLIYKDVDVFKLRSERKKWELKQKRERTFIQSTRE